MLQQLIFWCKSTATLAANDSYFFRSMTLLSFSLNSNMFDVHSTTKCKNGLSQIILIRIRIISRKFDCQINNRIEVRGGVNSFVVVIVGTFVRKRIVFNHFKKIKQRKLYFVERDLVSSKEVMKFLTKN